MSRISKKLQSLLTLLTLAGMLLPMIPQNVSAQTVNTAEYYRTIAAMSPNLMAGAGQPLSQQIQAANGNLSLINSAFQNAIRYAIETNNQPAVQEAFNLYQSFIRPALERQFALTNPENQNNIATLGGTLQNGLAPTLTQLNSLVNSTGNTGGGIIGSQAGFIATPQNTQQLAQVYNQLLALQGNRNAQLQLGGAFNPGINTADMAEGNFNILNVVQGVRALTADNVPGAVQANGAATILNSIGLDPNVAGPLSAVAGLLLQNNQTSNNLGNSLGGINSGLPQVTNLVGGLLGNILGGGGNVSQTGGAIRDFVTSTMMNGLRNRSNGQSIALPAGLGAATELLSGNVGGAVQGVIGLATGMTDKIKGVAGGGALEAVAAGASANPVASAMGMGGSSSCSAGGGTGGSPQSGPQAGAGSDPNESAYQKDFDYLTDPNGGGMSREDATSMLQNYGTGFAPDGYTPAGGSTSRTTTDASGRTIYDGSRLQGSDAPKPGIPSINPGPGQTSVSGTRTVVDGSKLQASDRPSPTADNTYLSPGRVGTSATNRNTVSAGTLADGVTLSANSNGNPASRGTQMGQQVLQTLLQNIGRSQSTGGQSSGQYNTGQRQQSYSGYPAAPTYAPSTITPAILEADLSAEFLRQLNQASTTYNTNGINLGSEVSLSPATEALLTGSVKLTTSAATIRAASNDLPTISDLASRAGSALFNFDSGPVNSALQGGLNSLLNGGNLSDIAQGAGEASFNLLGGKLLASNPVVQGALGSMLGGGGGKGVPVQIQKGAYFTVVENILKESKKQTKIQDELCRIARRQEKAQFTDDPAAYKKVTESVTQSDKIFIEQMKQTAVISNWTKEVDERIAKTLEKSHADMKKAGAPKDTQDVINATVDAVDKAMADRDAQFNASLKLEGYDDIKKAALTDDPEKFDTLAIALFTDPAMNTLYQQMRVMQHDINKINRLEGSGTLLSEINSSGGLKSETKQESSSNSQTTSETTSSTRTTTRTIGTGGGEGAGGSAPQGDPDIVLPGSIRKQLFQAALDRPAVQGTINTNTKEQEAAVAPTIPPSTQKKTNFGSQATAQPVERNNNDAGNWLSILLGLANNVFSNDDEDNNSPPPVLPPSLAIVTGTSTINGMLESGIIWGTQGISACTFTTNWISFGDGTAVTASPMNIQTSGSSATLRGGLFVYHPNVFKIEVELSPRNGADDPSQVGQFKTKLQRTYPAVGYTTKTGLAQETLYTPKLNAAVASGSATSGHIDISVKINGKTLTIVDVNPSAGPVSDNEGWNIINIIRDTISALPTNDPFRQLVAEKNLTFQSTPAGLIIRGSTIVEGQVPASATYTLSCIGDDDTTVQKSVTVRFGIDSITQ